MPLHNHSLSEVNASAKLGFDIGRVILQTDTDSARHINDMQHTRYIPGALLALADFVKDSRVDDVVLISKCGTKIQSFTEEFLDATGFYSQTGITPENVFFCRDRAQKPLIASELSLTHFVDDRQDVLQRMQGIVEHKYLFTADVENIPFRGENSHSIRTISGWSNVWWAIQETL